ncbi:MAG: tRNA (adenosine(37)-N6)-dimethylallyltransferase MiaA [Eubacteriales bacterium]|nr:tRNA (adenosine(37)-N6)-dimethylallyltransferase MiaA [Eubacteriales bacterium]
MKLIVIAGPTAVGKSAAAIALAKELNTEIISADSMQVYRGMDIGTAKVTKEEMDGVTHHLIDILDPSDKYNAYIFKELALKAAEDISSRGKIPIVCGGTGFYIQSLLYNIEFVEEDEDSEIRKELKSYGEENGIEALHRLLEECDPEYAAQIPKEDIKRVVRGVAFYRLHGEKISEHNKKLEENKNNSPFDYRLFVLTDDRERLKERINRRVDQMMEAGLLNEVKELLKTTDKTAVSMQGIGYKEIVAYLEGNCTLEEAVEQIKTGTRRYAKRQITWFKREKNAIWIDVSKGDTSNELRRNLW